MIRLTPCLTFLLITLLALFSTSCSTLYVGHTDEIQPYKSERLSTEVKFTKQDNSSVDKTTMDYLLSKNSSIVNYYNGTDTYKRSSWLGKGIMIASAAVAWYGIDTWRNAQETIPPYDAPNPDYENEKQLGQNITFCAIGGVLTGVVVHFIANKELKQNTVKEDAVVESEPLPYSQIKLYHEDRLISNQQTDENGSFKVDLSPFFLEQYRGKDIEIKIFAPEYASVVENLSVTSSSIAWSAQTSHWNEFGFSSDAMQEWIQFGFLTPQAASPWKQADLSPFEANSWKEKGLTAAQAQERLEKERKAEALAKDKEEAKRRERENLEAQAKDMATLIITNPYDVKDKLYKVTGIQFQLFGKSTALYNAGNFVFLADFGSASAPYIFQGLARGVGPYTYLTTLGAQNIVPSLNVLFW